MSISQNHIHSHKNLDRKEKFLVKYVGWVTQKNNKPYILKLHSILNQNINLTMIWKESIKNDTSVIHEQA